MHHKVTVYYDETTLSSQKLCGHVLFFVPSKIDIQNDTALFGSISESYNPRTELISRINNLRYEFSGSHKLHFSKISGKNWTKNDRFTQKVINLLTECLKRKKPLNLKKPLFCKVAVLYYPEDTDNSLYGGSTASEKKLRFTETTLRILLKGACHYLYDENNTVQISDFIVDGKPANRDFDDERILKRLSNEEIDYRSELRSYVKFDPMMGITHLDSNHTLYAKESIEYEHANLLQCADLLLGSFNYALLDPQIPTNQPYQVKEICECKKSSLSFPIFHMIGKVDRKGGFSNSSHYKMFTASKLIFEKNGIRFQNYYDLYQNKMENNNLDIRESQLVLNID